MTFLESFLGARDLMLTLTCEVRNYYYPCFGDVETALWREEMTCPRSRPTRQWHRGHANLGLFPMLLFTVPASP